MRIAKSDVYKSLELAAKNIEGASGGDGRTSRTEMAAALKALSGNEKALTDIFFKFIDNRDAASGASVTPADLKKALAYAKKEMVADYDLNNNGLSQSEIAKMSRTASLAVGLSQELKGRGTGPLSTAQLGKAITALAPNANFTTESDYLAEFVSAKAPNGSAPTTASLMKAFGPMLTKWFEGEGYGADTKFATDLSTEAETKRYFADIADIASAADADANNGGDYYTKSAVAFSKIKGLMEANLTNIRHFEMGPSEDDGSFGDSNGLYAEMIVGTTADGKYAGIMYGAVYT